MKKYILSLFIVGFTLISFSSATNLNISCEIDEENGGDLCTPDYITLDTNSCIDGDPQITLSNFSCEFPEDYEEDSKYCGISLQTADGVDNLNIAYYNGELIDNTCYIVNDNTEFEVHTYVGDSSFDGTLIIPGNNSGGGNEGGNEGGNTGGNNGGSNGSSSSIIPGGSDGLTPAINGLKGTVYELIPYIVYIGIGVLLMILGFYAIRWLVNWLGGKINSYFNSKRG